LNEQWVLANTLHWFDQEATQVELTGRWQLITFLQKIPKAFGFAIFSQTFQRSGIVAAVGRVSWQAVTESQKN